MNKSAQQAFAAVKKPTSSGETSSNADTMQSKAASSNATLFKIAGVILAAAFSWYVYSSSSSSILNLSKASDAELQEALFKPHKPYIFYCIKGIKGDDMQNVPAVFKDMHASRGSKYTFALLDCNKKITAPAGSLTKSDRKAQEEAAAAEGAAPVPVPVPAVKKSIFDIYKVNRKIKPTVFMTAPWFHPQLGGPGSAKQVPDGQLGDAATLRKYVDATLRPRAAEASSDAELHRLCGWGKHARKDASVDASPSPSASASASPGPVGRTCVALVKGKRHGKEQVELEEKLIREFPQNRYISVPASKQSIKLTLNSADAVVPADSFALQIHAMRNNSHYLSMSTPVTWDYVKTFVSRASSAPLTDFSAAGAEGISFGAGEKSSSFKKRAAKAYAPPSADPTDSPDSGSGSGSASSPQTPEELAAAKASKERRAREEMDRQANEANIEEVGEEDEEEEAEEDEGEEDVMEL